MFRFIEQRLSLYILFFTVPLLFIPKINLFSLDAAETAGVRIDDIILFSLSLFLLFFHFLSHEKLFKIEGWILLITTFSIFSFFSNQLLVLTHHLQINAKIFYTLRLLEYFLFFYLGIISFRNIKNSESIITLFFLWNLTIIFFQKFAVLGALSVTGYAENVSQRVQGIASFPSEMGLILNLLFCYLIYDEKLSSRFNQSFLKEICIYFLFALFAVLIIFTGNRISILALFFCFSGYMWKMMNWRSPLSIFFLLFSLFILIGLGFIITQSEGVYERSINLFSWKNFELFNAIWDKIDIDHSSIPSELTTYKGYDESWWIRIHKWLFAIKCYLFHPVCYLQGLGPGFCGAALDGGLLRILIENGVIGAFLYWKFFYGIYRINLQTKWMIIAFMINMIFFDAYLAYKAMSLLFFASGNLFEKHDQLRKVPSMTFSAG